MQSIALVNNGVNIKRKGKERGKKMFVEDLLPFLRGMNVVKKECVLVLCSDGSGRFCDQNNLEIFYKSWANLEELEKIISGIKKQVTTSEDIQVGLNESAITDCTIKNKS